jgi:mannose-6-phosphate isomerase-like protein (cupin superfamily)
MRVYETGEGHLLCGHWNGSPVEIGLTPLIREVPANEAQHSHDYHEYYLVLEGSAELEVEGTVTLLQPGTVAMVQPGERHRIVFVSPPGARWVIIKERSAPGSKRLV